MKYDVLPKMSDAATCSALTTVIYLATPIDPFCLDCLNNHRHNASAPYPHPSVTLTTLI